MEKKYIDAEELIASVSNRENHNPLYAPFRICTADTTDLKFLLKDAPAADVAPVQRWISVKERLPQGADDSGKLCQNVRLKMSDGYITAGWMNGITGKVYYLDTTSDAIQKAPMSRVTHWKPLD